MRTRRQVLKDISLAIGVLVIDPIKIANLFVAQPWKPLLPYEVMQQEFDYYTQIGICVKIKDKRYGFVFEGDIENFKGIPVIASEFVQKCVRLAFKQYESNLNPRLQSSYVGEMGGCLK